MTNCKDLAQALLECLRQTDCMKNGGSAKDCMAVEQAPDCQVLRNTYFECKRAQLDMRSRIRGARQH